MIYPKKHIASLFRSTAFKDSRSEYLRLDMNESPSGLPSNFVKKVLSRITLGLVKVSVFVFLWISFRRFGLSSIFAGLGSLFLFFGTSSLCPWRYYLLFDSSNFLFFTVHSGRIAGVAMVLFLIFNFLREDSDSKPLSLLMIMLAGTGLTALPESNAIWALALIPWMLPLKIEKYSIKPHFIYFSLFAVILMYSLPFNSNIFINVRLLAVGVSVLTCGWILVTRLLGCMGGSKPKRGLLALFLSILVGMILMGNIFRDNAISSWTFQRLEPMIGNVEHRDLSGNLLSKSPLKIGDSREIGTYNEYCKGVLEFIAYYGWVLVMIALIPYFYFQLVNGGSLLDQRFYRIFAYIVTSMPLLFFIMDFTNWGPMRAWLKSRLLEVPVYFIIFIFFYFLGRAATKIERLVLGIIFVVYIVTPLLATERPRQMWENGKNVMQKDF